MIDGPLSQLVANPAIQQNKIFGEICDLVGIRDPEKLAEANGGPGSIVNALFESCGIPDEIAALVGVAIDGYTGNVPGVISNAADAHNVDEGTLGSLFQFTQMIPM